MFWNMLILCPLFHKDSWHFCQKKLPACPWAQPLGWLGWFRCCKQAEHECALLLAKFTQGDYLFNLGVKFQGQSPQLAVERLRTPGTEAFTDPAIGELPTGGRVFTCETVRLSFRQHGSICHHSRSVWTPDASGERLELGHKYDPLFFVCSCFLQPSWACSSFEERSGASLLSRFLFKVLTYLFFILKM